MKNYDPWSQNAIDKLRALWPTSMTATEIAREIGVSKNAVCGKAHRLMLKGKKAPPRYWTGEMLTILITLWPTWDVKAIAEKLGVSPNAVSHKAYRLELKRKYPHKSPKEPRWMRAGLVAPKTKIPQGESFGPGIPFKRLQESHCRYIGGDTRGIETLFCGLPKASGSYCGFHAELCTYRR